MEKCAQSFFKKEKSFEKIFFKKISWKDKSIQGCGELSGENMEFSD